MRKIACLSLILKLLLCLFTVSMLTSAALAQPATGGIKGTVTDPQKAVVAGADVSLKNVSTGAERKAVTDASGQF